ncbi:aKG-HExxH-type peptide beta-hydroxylase [Streptomyces sp. NPDC001595]|uniref:aKG-HExxH-type peptide beta-hydroxylase n=1 Tax=Streptomyces sp. NPDC001532 TaxID=3154520 RepID=UPI00332151ED
MSRPRKGAGEPADPTPRSDPAARAAGPQPSVTSSGRRAVAVGQNAHVVITGDGNVVNVQPLPHERAVPGPGLAGGDVALPSVTLPPRRVARERIRGRDRLISQVDQEVRNRLADGVGEGTAYVLSGLGGCGKTTAALEIAHRLAPAMAHTWWVSDADGDLRGSMKALALAAGAAPQELTPVNTADVLWQRLDSLTRPWLLVLDNMDDPDSLLQHFRRLRPVRAPGTVLVTSRNSPAWPDATVLPVDTLDPETGARVLMDLAPHAGDEPAARRLAERLGGLPLALYLAGAYLGTRRVRQASDAADTFDTYRLTVNRRLREEDVTRSPGAALDRDPGRRTIRTTWELSLRLLESVAERDRDSGGYRFARPLLRLLSCFALAPIPHQQLVASDVLAGSPMFRDITRDELDTAIAGLESLGLVRVEQAADHGATDAGVRWVLTLHPLVREINRLHDDPENQASRYLVLVVELLARATDRLDPGHPGDWPLWRHWAPHCSAPLRLPGLPDSDPELLIRATGLALGAAEYRTHMGIYDEALAELRFITDLRARRLGEDHRATLASRVSLAWALRDNGELQASAEEYGKSIELLGSTAVPDDDPLAQSARAGWARVLRGLGGSARYATAERELRTVLDIRRRDPVRNAWAILRTRRDIATVLHKRGLLQEAVEELRAVYKESRDALGEWHIDTLSIGTSLARVLRDAGWTDEAEEVIEQVLEGCGEVLADDHPNALVARHERARIRRDLGWYAEAEKEFAGTWPLLARRFGAGHPDTLASRHELATVLHLSGCLDEAAGHYRAVCDGLEQRLGTDHPDAVVCRGNLARVLEETAHDERHGPAQGVALMIDDPQDGDAVPDFANLRLREAFALPAAVLDLPAVQRGLRRFTSPRVSRGGGEAGGYGGLSEYVSASSTGGSYERTYRPPAPRRAEPEPEPPREPEAQSRRLTPAARRAADGREARALVDVLIRQERGLRVAALCKIRIAAEEAGPHLHPSLPHVTAVNLLAAVDEEAPDIMDDLLLHPATGRWMAHVLRRLDDGEDDAVAVPLWVDLGHLHALAAAAGIRAGISFTCRVPVRDGVVQLPTLGYAEAGFSRPETAVVRAEAGEVVVEVGHGTVPVPDPVGRGPSRWHEPHRLSARTAAASWAPVLDDLDPFRRPDGPAAPDRLAPERAARWQRVVQQAWRSLIRADAARAEAIGRAVTALTPLRPAQDGRTGMSLTSTDAFGGVVLDDPRDAEELAATLVHEFRHMQLAAVQHGVTLHTADGTADLGYAPWRDDPRPFAGRFHGVFAYLGVTEFWWRLSAASSTGTARRRAQFEAAYWGRETWDVFTALRSSRHLTRAGRAFMDELEKAARPWREEAGLPEDVVALATEAAAGQRVRWRLHHLAVDPQDCARLTHAFTVGAERPHVSGGFAALRPDPGARLLDAGLPLPREAAVDFEEFRRARHTVADGDPRASDIARLLGDLPRATRLAVERIAGDPAPAESWVRLALAVRRDAEVPEAARRALVQRPELVRAVYDRVRRSTNAAPEPIRLAAWIDGPGDRELPPVAHPW